MCEVETRKKYYICNASTQRISPSLSRVQKQTIQPQLMRAKAVNESQSTEEKLGKSPIKNRIFFSCVVRARWFHHNFLRMYLFFFSSFSPLESHLFSHLFFFYISSFFHPSGLFVGHPDNCSQSTHTRNGRVPLESRTASNLMFYLITWFNCWLLKKPQKQKKKSNRKKKLLWNGTKMTLQLAQMIRNLGNTGYSQRLHLIDYFWAILMSSNWVTS